MEPALVTLASRPFAMIVEHTEPFQAWLAKVLKPLCDADPGALAKYVLALIKKDKSEKELRQSMIDQLDVFLQSETKPFVDKLFEALNTKEYLNAKSSSSPEAVQSSKSESASGGGGDIKGSSSENSAKTERPPVSSLSASSETDPISSTSGPTSSVNANQTSATSSSGLSSQSSVGNEVAATSSNSSSSSKKGSNTLSVTPSALLNSEATPASATSISSSSHADSKEDPKTTASSSSRPRDRRDDDRDKNRRKRSRTDRDRRSSRSRSADRGVPNSKRSRSPRLDRERDRDRERIDRPLRHRLGGRKSPPPRRYDRDVWDRRRSRSPLGGRNRSCSPRNSNRSRSPPPPRYRRPFNSSRSRSRSPIARGGDRSRSPRSRSRSPHSKDASKDPSKKDSLLPIPPGLDADLAIKELAEKTPIVQSVVVRPGGSQGTHSSQDSSQPSSGTSAGSNNRCRDFDEKGLCMRGELCPFDHGNDPVVLEDIVVPGVGSGGPGGYGAAGRGMVPGTPGYNPPLARPAMVGEYYPDSPSLEPPMGWGPGAPPFRPRHMGFDAVAARGGRGGLILRPSGMGPYPVPGGQRQLISVPVVGGGGIPPAPGVPVMGGGPHHGVPPGMPPMVHPGLRGMGMRGGHRGGRGGFDHGRLGAKPSHHHHHHPHRNYTNCSLEVRKIPREQNTIMDLNSHFLRFGKIINIQINYDSDPEAALVTFSSPAEAQLAYRSTEAVLNNRFIRVFWHNKEKENEEEAEAAAASGNAPNPPRIPVKDRLGAQTQDQMPMEHEKILLSGNNLTKTVYNNAALLNKKMETQQDKLQATESIKRSQEILAAQVTLKNLQEQKKAEALKMSNDLRKRQQTMMEEQIGQQKKLIAKLESGTLSNKEKEETLKILKVLQDSVSKLKKDLDDSTPAKNQHPHHQVIINNKPVVVGQGVVVGAAAGNLRTKEEAQKEMLDAELDLINKEQQGGDTIDLQKKVIELRARAKSLGLIGQGVRGRGGYRGMGRGFGRGGRGIMRGRGRGSVRALRSVDRRPTKIRITGCDASKFSDILGHFSVFGQIRDYVSDANVPMMIIDFDSRKCAEVAMANGQMLEDMKLSLEWVTENAGEGASGKPGEGSLSTANNGESSNHHDELNTNETIDDDDEMAEDELGVILDSSEICLTGEDEEEDEDDRSWRR